MERPCTRGREGKKGGAARPPSSQAWEEGKERLGHRMGKGVKQARGRGSMGLRVKMREEVFLLFILFSFISKHFSNSFQ